MPTSPTEWSSLHDGRLAAMIEVSRAAGEHTLKYFRSSTLTIDAKSDDSPVTIADREAEQLARRLLLERFPDDTVQGEEFDDQAGTSEYRWVIDPIDGTKSFVCGVPLYSTLLALELNGDPLGGVIFIPALDEIIVAAIGHGAWTRCGEQDRRDQDRRDQDRREGDRREQDRRDQDRRNEDRGDQDRRNEDRGDQDRRDQDRRDLDRREQDRREQGRSNQEWERASVSAKTELSEAVFATTEVTTFDLRNAGDTYRKLESATWLTRTWGDGYGYLLVATGRADLMVDPLCNPWDVAAILPVVVEAGGKFTDWKGNQTARGGDGLGTNGKLHQEVLRLLK